jgi:hypothetical protein
MLSPLDYVPGSYGETTRTLMDGGLKGIQQSYRVNKHYNGNARKVYATLCSNWRLQDCLATVTGFESGSVSQNTKSATASLEYAPRRKTGLMRPLRSFSSKYMPGVGSSWGVWSAFFFNEGLQASNAFGVHSSKSVSEHDSIQVHIYINSQSFDRSGVPSHEYIEHYQGLHKYSCKVKGLLKPRF